VVRVRAPGPAAPVGKLKTVIGYQPPYAYEWVRSTSDFRFSKESNGMARANCRCGLIRETAGSKLANPFFRRGL
jgi:hypothetical protein